MSGHHIFEISRKNYQMCTKLHPAYYSVQSSIVARSLSIFYARDLWQHITAAFLPQILPQTFFGSYWFDVSIIIFCVLMVLFSDINLFLPQSSVKCSIRDYARSYQNRAQMRTQLCAIDVQKKRSFERFVFSSSIWHIWALSRLSLCTRNRFTRSSWGMRVFTWGLDSSLEVGRWQEGPRHGLVGLDLIFFLTFSLRRGVLLEKSRLFDVE